MPRLSKWETIDLVLIECLTFSLFFYFNRSFLLNSLVVVGDIPVYNLNSDLTYILSQTSPWYFLIHWLIYRTVPTLYPLVFNSVVVFVEPLASISMYFLLRELSFPRASRILGSIIYIVNPISLVYFAGLEYGLPFLMFPIIVTFLFRYNERRGILNLVYAALLIALLTNVNQLSYSEWKILILVTIPFLILPFLSINGARLKKTIKHYLVGFGILLLSVTPALVQAFNDLRNYTGSYSISTSTIEEGITKYVFSQQTFQNSFAAVEAYPGTSIWNSNYLYSWSYVGWLILIILSYYAVIAYHGKRKKMYRLLLIISILLVLFQYSVYNGSLLFLFRNSIVDVLNYPVFFNVVQLFFYTIFFAQFVENITAASNSREIGPKNAFKSERLKDARKYTVVLLLTFVILLSSAPIVHYEGGLNYTQESMPSYWDNITATMENFQNARVLVLPENVTTITYLSSTIPYSNIYGLPYNWWAFPSRFPNESIITSLFEDFQSKNISGISKILTNQSINVILILSPQVSSAIVANGYYISGGGEEFVKELKNTSLYSPVQVNKNYDIFALNFSSYYPISNQTLLYGSNNIGIQNKTISINLSPTSAIVTSDKSHLSIPIVLNTTSDLNQNVVDYQQELFIPRSLSTYISANYSNILFSYPNGSLIPAWIQSINKSGALIWLKLSTNGIKTLFLNVYPSNVFLLNANGEIGEAPQLSGTGSPLLPSYVVFSVACVAVYGYGPVLNRLTINFSFNPSLYSNLENGNLTNIEFFSYNGTELHSRLLDGATNKSSNAVVAIEFPGTSYFEKYKSTVGSGIFDTFNIFYMGFANTSDDLSALQYPVDFSQQDAMSVGYMFSAVRDSGSYGKYDNGKLVFDNYTNFSNINNSYATAWEFGISIPGYGFVGASTYSPLSTMSNAIFNLSYGQIGETFANISAASGETTSPSMVTNNPDVGLYGNSPLNPENFSFGKGLNIEVVGWGTNGTNNLVQGDYNSFSPNESVFRQLTPGYKDNNYNLYGIYLNDSGPQLMINGRLIGGSRVQMNGPFYYGMSLIFSGWIQAFYSYIRTSPVLAMPSYSFGNILLYQATMDGLNYQNPTETGVNVTFGAFALNMNGNLNFTWNISGHLEYGQAAMYSFNRTGNYSVGLTIKNSETGTYLTDSIIEKVLSPLAVNLSAISMDSNGIATFKARAINGTGAVIFEWYADGSAVNSTNDTVALHFRQYGIHSVEVVVIDSSGKIVGSNTVYIDVTGNSQENKTDYLIIAFNCLFFPSIALFFILTRKKVTS